MGKEVNNVNKDNTNQLMEFIESIENDTNLNTKIKKKQISSLIIEFMETKGTFIKSSIKFYYFDKDEICLYDFSSQKFSYMISTITGINMTLPIFNYILKDIEVYIHNFGEKVDVKDFAHYNKSNNTLYISNNGNQIIKIEKNKIDVINNGDDGIIFIGKENYTKWNFINNIKNDKDYIAELVDSITFTQGNLEIKEQKFIIKQYIYSLFFGTLLSNRPVLTFVGEKGSGKSFFFEILQLIFFGENISLGNLPLKEDDLKVNLMNNYLCVFDNVDNKIQGGKIDILCSVATGSSIKIRKLYSNGEQIDKKINCFLGITSRNPTFKRDDFSDRLLLFYLSRRSTFNGANQIKQEYLNKRNYILSNLCLDLQNILGNLENFKSYETTFRMSDFVNLIYNFNKDKINYIKNIFEGLMKNQQNLTTSSDDLLELLNELLSINYKDKKFKQGEYYKAIELHKIFINYTNKFNHLKYTVNNGMSLGRLLNNKISVYKNLYNINIDKKEVGSNIVKYAISKQIYDT